MNYKLKKRNGNIYKLKRRYRYIGKEYYIVEFKNRGNQNKYKEDKLNSRIKIVEL